MKKIYIVYGAQPGFIWLWNNNGVWGGRVCRRPRKNPYLRKALLVRVGKVDYHFYFRFPKRVVRTGRKKDRWRPMTKESSAQYFDIWALPLNQMSSVEREYLPQLLRDELHIRKDVEKMPVHARRAPMLAA